MKNVFLLMTIAAMFISQVSAQEGRPTLQKDAYLGNVHNVSLNENIKINFHAPKEGYLTILIRNPKGAVDMILRDLLLSEGEHSFDIKSDVLNQSGNYTVKTIFSETRTPTDFSLGGVMKDSTWHSVGYDLSNIKNNFKLQEYFFVIQ